MIDVDVDAVAAEIADAAAVEIAPRFGRLEPGEKREKGPNDPVTVADEAMERRLTETLPSFFDAEVLGEEGASADPERLNRLKDPAPLWIVDPVDGTSNFAAGRAPCAVIVALCAADVVEAAWIHDPLGRETISATRRGGAWAGEVRITTPAPPAHGLIGSVSARFMAEDEKVWADAVADAFPVKRSLFCAGAEYAALAKGDRHFCAFKRLMPWDHAAGALIVTEAGGRVGYADDGGAYRPSRLDGVLLSAGSATLWARIAAAGAGEADG